MNEIPQSPANRKLATWLLFCAAVVFLMIMLGGLTRLTGSGLSIVEWEPIMGTIPPLSEADWQELFDKYKASPQYQQVNQGMDLEGFKGIFWLEYLHRVLGRIIGIIFLLPLIYFAIKRQVPKELMPKLVGLFVLGGLQGFLGWYMVKSGLVDVPRVSQYRLTAHLGLAVLIYAAMIWIALSLIFAGRPAKSKVGQGFRIYSYSISVLLFFMILSGGLVSGIHAGFAYNTFPLMDGHFFPPGLYGLESAWASAFNDITTVQFNHRIFAYTLFLLITLFLVLGLRAGMKGRARAGTIFMMLFLLIQVSLGISTLILVVPITLAVLHQGGAVLLFTLSLFVSHSLRSDALYGQRKRAY